MESVRKVNVLTEIMFPNNKNLPWRTERLKNLSGTKDYDEDIQKYFKENEPSFLKLDGNDFTLRDFSTNFRKRKLS